MAWDDVSRWQPVDLAAAFKMGDAVQPVDVRDIGYRESEAQVKIAGLPDGKELIFYCDRPGEATSLKIAMWAFDNGRSRVGVLVGGWPAWQDAGYPVEPKAG